MTKDLIHFNTAMAITGLSKRTLWRRIADGIIGPCAKDRDGKSLLDLSAVLSCATLPLEPSDTDLIRRADAGDPQAQSDLALMLLEAGRHESAIQWLEMAAEKGYADAMSWLGRCHLVGQGLPRDANRGLMWLSNAAAHGHPIAKEQISGLTRAD